VCLALFSIGNAAPAKTKLSHKERQKILKNIAPRYRHWYEMVYHISTRDEHNVFLSLTNNRDRDIFIQAFWQQRDPTPGTNENEYKDEIQKRFAYVQKYFSRSSSKPGWMTDMGEFYMILGKPNSIERFDSKPGLYPAQVWYYFGDQSLGLPTYFNITFYRPNNTTEWKFYNPSVDGPAALLIKQQPMAEANYEGIYRKIKELAPELAMPAMTMIPNQIAVGFRPPHRNNIVLSNIHESPTRRINVSYATHFLNYKGYVELESSINYIENSKLVTITKYDRFNFPFVNISLKPKRISVGFSGEKNQYYFNYELSVSLRKGDTFIYEYKKNFDFYIDPDKVNQLKGNGIIVHDSFPAIPGKYKLTVFAMNSVGKEFTYFEKDIEVPAMDQKPLLGTPVIGYKTEEQRDNFFFPYKFGDRKLYLDTARNLKLNETPRVLIGAYNLDEELWKTGSVEVLVKGINERKKFKKSFRLPLARHPFRRDLNIFQLVTGKDGGGLDPDYYEVEVTLLDGAGSRLDSKTTTFSISPLRTFAYPMETFKKIRAENPYFFYYTLGSQYEKNGGIPEAEEFYARSIRGNPEFKAGYVPYLNILNKQKKYTQVLVEVETIKDDEKLAFDYHLVKGTALYGMKDYDEALSHLVKANTIYDSDPRVLNLLGFTFLNLNDYEQGLKALEASLNLDKKQDFIRKTVQEVKKRMAAQSKTTPKSN
jgi:GWxTD domain-containing protein